MFGARPPVPNGARQHVFCTPLLQAAEANVVQSPANMAAVGTLAWLTPGFSCRTLYWKPPKKNNLSLRMGPPMVPPNWLRL